MRKQEPIGHSIKPFSLKRLILEISQNENLAKIISSDEKYGC